MLTKIQNKKRLIAKSTDRTKQEPNCIGTVLYIFGIIRKDEYLGSESRRWKNGIVDEFLDKLVPINKPVEGAVLVVQERHYNKRINHMAIVTSVDPPTIFHRPGIDEKISPNDSLDSVIEYYGNDHSYKFYARQSSLKK
jgi:hypothetical protein